MSDIALLLILLGLTWVAWLHPWLGVLGLAVLSFMHPQGYAAGFIREVPVYLLLFFWVSISTLFHAWRDKSWAALPWLRLRDWRILGLLGLWLWFGVSSYFSVAPWEAWVKYLDVLKILPPLLLTLLLIDSREKFHYLVVVIALSFLLLAFKGGYWAVLTGFHDRVYGPSGSQYGDNNGFAVAVAMAIPLMVSWMRSSHDHALRIVLGVGIALSYAAVVSSWSRGGLLALGAMTLVLVLHGKRKLLAIPLLLLLAGILFVQLPEQWFGRMETFVTLESDQSAQNRLQAWRIGLDFAAHHPVFGGGFNAWPALTLGSVGIDWHSAYVEILTEHGYVGLVGWLSLLISTWLGPDWAKSWNQSDWLKDGRVMLRASLTAYLVGGLTLGIAYWEFPYLLIVLAVLLKGFSSDCDKNSD